MKFALPLALLAGPVAAHPASHAHLHSDGIEGVIVGLALVAVFGATLLINKARK